MSRPRAWTMIFVCREKGNDPSSGEKAMKCLLDQDARYITAYYEDFSGKTIFPGKKGWENFDPTNLEEAVKTVTSHKGGLIDFKLPLDRNNLSTDIRNYMNWVTVSVFFRPHSYHTLPNLKLNNFIFAVHFSNYLLAAHVDAEEWESWEEDAKIKIPGLVEVCRALYKRIRPHYTVIIPAIEYFDPVHADMRNPFNIYSPELLNKVGRNTIVDNLWWKCEELEDGGLECWAYPLLMDKEGGVGWPGKGFEKLRIPIFEIAGNL